MHFVTRQRGSYAKGLAKREEILAVALQVVAEQGCRSTSIREIARRVGLSQPGLMHHFETREALYVEVLRTRDALDRANFIGATDTFEGFLDVIRHNTSVPGLVQLYVEFSAEASVGKHPAHGFFKERYAWVREGTVRSIRNAQESGELGPDIDVEKTADLIVASADGLQQQWLIDRSIDMVARLELLWQFVQAESWASSRSTKGSAEEKPAAAQSIDAGEDASASPRASEADAAA